MSQAQEQQSADSYCGQNGGCGGRNHPPSPGNHVRLSHNYWNSLQNREIAGGSNILGRNDRHADDLGRESEYQAEEKPHH